jgi:hypothetical protein
LGLHRGEQLAERRHRYHHRRVEEGGSGTPLAGSSAGVGTRRIGMVTDPLNC